MTEPFKIAIAGLGTVGSALVQLLQEEALTFAKRTGRQVQITAVSARDRKRNRGLDLSGIDWVDDPQDLAKRDDVDAVIELIGGADDPAKALCEAALTQGKAVVSANKALIATHGPHLARLAEQNNAPLMFEAAVAGAIPVLKVLAEGLAGNRIESISGILNGTCNYILSTMAENGAEFADVLAEAQRLGYAEAEPSLDVDGVDTAHKLAILASLAFGCPPNMKGVYTEGITQVSAADITAAAQLGYAIRLIGFAHVLPQGLSQRVYPCLVPLSSSFGHVNGVTNAVAIKGYYAGPVMLQGYGAGGSPTASAVAADIADLAAGRQRQPFSQAADTLIAREAVPMTSLSNSFYLRLLVDDHPGVVADLSGMLAANDISIDHLSQRPTNHNNKKAASLVLTTHAAKEADMLTVQNALAQRDYLLQDPVVLRIEAGLV